MTVRWVDHTENTAPSRRQRIARPPSTRNTELEKLHDGVGRESVGATWKYKPGCTLTTWTDATNRIWECHGQKFIVRLGIGHSLDFATRVSWPLVFLFPLNGWKHPDFFIRNIRFLQHKCSWKRPPEINVLAMFVRNIWIFSDFFVTSPDYVSV